jgi:hypothetical protein
MINSSKLASTLMVVKDGEEANVMESEIELSNQNEKHTNLELNVNIKKICINLRGPKTLVDTVELKRKQKLRS